MASLNCRGGSVLRGSSAFTLRADSEAINHMAQAWRVRAGTRVRYRTAGGRVYAALVTTVTNQTTLNLRIGTGPTKQTITGALRRTAEGTGAGWYRSGSDF